jgi:hypothetical protein
MERNWIKECLSVYRGFGIGIIIFSTEKGKGRSGATYLELER